MRRWKLVLGMLLMVAALACGRGSDDARSTISREKFIETFVALQLIQGDSMVLDSLRAVVLEEQGVTEEEMRRFVAVRGENPEELAQIWEEVHQRLVSLVAEARAGGDTTGISPDTAAVQPDTVATSVADTFGVNPPQDNLAVEDTLGQQLRRRPLPTDQPHPDLAPDLPPEEIQ